VDEWVDELKPVFTGLDASSQHTMTNPVCELDGDAATCQVAMQAEHVLAPRRCSGVLHDRRLLHQLPQMRGTASAHRLVDRPLADGDRSITTQATERGRARLMDAGEVSA